MRKSLFKRCFAIMLIFAICFIAIPKADVTKIDTEAKTIEELEKEIDQLKKKQQEYKSMISSLGSDITKEKQKQAAISNQIKTTQSLIDTLNTQIETLESNISDQEKKIADQEAKIDAQIQAFQQRVRAMYLAGNDSVAAVLLGSTDFFDMLMKLELIERVSEHDNNMINDLIALKNDYEATKASLEENKKSLEA